VRAAELATDVREVGANVAALPANFMADDAFGMRFLEEQLAAAARIAVACEGMLLEAAL
jgi:hypothetical protein